MVIGGKMVTRKTRIAAMAGHANVDLASDNIHFRKSDRPYQLGSDQSLEVLDPAQDSPGHRKGGAYSRYHCVDAISPASATDQGVSMVDLGYQLSPTDDAIAEPNEVCWLVLIKRPQLIRCVERQLARIPFV